MINEELIMCSANAVCEYAAKSCGRLALAMSRYQAQADVRVDLADKLDDLNISFECGTQAIQLLLVMMTKISGERLAQSILLLKRIQENLDWMTWERDSLRLALT